MDRDAQVMERFETQMVGVGRLRSQRQPGEDESENRSPNVIQDLGSRFVTLDLNQLHTKPVPRQFAMRQWFPKGVSTAVIGDYETYKTTTLLEATVHYILAMPFHNIEPETEPRHALIVSAEDPMEDWYTKLYALLHAPGRQRLLLRAQEIVERLHFLNVRGLGFQLASMDDRVARVAIGHVETLIAETNARFPVGLTILETASRVNGAGETNEGMSKLVEAGDRIAEGTGSAFVISHHISKGAARMEDITAHASRGGSALEANCRSVINFIKPTSETIGLPDEIDRDDVSAGLIVRVRHPKSSYATAAPDLWLRRESGDGGPFMNRIYASPKMTPEARVIAFVRQQNAMPEPPRMSARHISDHHKAIGVPKHDIYALLSDMVARRELAIRRERQYGDKGKEVDVYDLP